MTREVRLFAAYKNDAEGEHITIVKSGTWQEVVAYMNTRTPYAGTQRFFVEGTDGQLRPLMA